MPAADGASRTGQQPAGILLAAGEGRRFGRPKALVAFHGEPLVRRGVRLLVAAGCSPIVVVVGADAARVAAAVRDRDANREQARLNVTVVENPDWHEGMGASLRVGVATARGGRAPAAVVALVDQPLVAPRAVRRLIDAWRRGATIAVATYAGVQRNPVLFDARTFDAVQASAVGDRGARALLRERSEWVEPVACDAVASPRDVDTADDLLELEAEPDPHPVARGRSASKEQQWN